MARALLVWTVGVWACGGGSEPTPAPAPPARPEVRADAASAVTVPIDATLAVAAAAPRPDAGSGNGDEPLGGLYGTMIGDSIGGGGGGFGFGPSEELDVAGGLDAGKARAVVRPASEAAHACYRPTEAFDLRVTIAVSAAGGTGTVAVDGATSDALANCVRRGYARLAFGPTTDGKPAVVHHHVGDKLHPGYDTIGTGDIGLGTLGHGYGTGVGLGHGPRAAAPHLGSADATGALPKEVIRRLMKRQIQKIQYCYEKALVAQPTLAGTVRVTFTIAADGTVSDATATGVDDAVASCVAGVVKDITFPRPDGGVVHVTYPFAFQPTGG